MKKYDKKKRVSALLLSLTMTAALFAGAVTALADESGYTEAGIPIAENLELTTYKDVPLSGTLSAYDPDGGELTFNLTKQGKKGIADVSADGRFIYTPGENRKGKDSFCFTVSDSDGNVSEPAVVSIKIKAQTTDICYSDMRGNSAEYSALCLAENGIFTGEKIGDCFYFSPDAPVSRIEFLTMCMTMCGVDTLDDVTKTGFFDDDTLPVWSKPYVATALMAGIIKGYIDDDGNAVFSGSAPITYTEAAVILDNVLDVTDVSAELCDDGLCPTWACQSVANLSSCNIIDGYGEKEAVYTMTRADTAEMLASSLSLMDNRADAGLFGWF